MASHQHKHKHKHIQDETILANVAQSIGSTLGTIAAKARGIPDALSQNSFVRTAEREGKKLVGEAKTVAKRAKKAASKNADSHRFKRASRRSSRHATVAPKRAARPISARKKASRRVRRKK
jgi:hypothetical protein